MAAAPSPSTEPKLPWPSTKGYRMEKSCARRTMASYTEASPWGWNLPSTSPTIRADLRKGLSGVMPNSFISKRMRRCTGFKPSRTSGSARLMMTAIAYAMNEVFISDSRSAGSSRSLISLAILRFLSGDPGQGSISTGTDSNSSLWGTPARVSIRMVRDRLPFSAGIR